MTQNNNLTRKQLDKAISIICKDRGLDNDSIIISQNELAAVLEVEMDIEVAPITIRRKGVCDKGYYQKKYPEIFDYSQIGDTRIRGLLVKPKKWLNEVSNLNVTKR